MHQTHIYMKSMPRAYLRSHKRALQLSAHSLRRKDMFPAVAAESDWRDVSDTGGLHVQAQAYTSNAVRRWAQHALEHDLSWYWRTLCLKACRPRCV